MMTEPSQIDSASVGDPARYRSLDDLEGGLIELSPPRAAGRVALIVRRGHSGRRETLDRIRLAPETGVPGDGWGRQKNPRPETQLAVIQIDIATLIANGQPLELFGDNLFLDLDLSQESLPRGSLVRAGGTVLEVTAQPHNGCQKFRERFGVDALRFVSRPDLRHRNLRGIYMRVVESGEIAAGDPAVVISRPA